MQYIILSDIHENFHNLQIAITYAKSHQITKGIVLGDLVNPGIMHSLGKSAIEFTVILGNNDGDVFGLCKMADKYKNIDLHKDYVSKEFETVKAFLVHDNILGTLVAKSHEYPIVMCGHNHIAVKEVYGTSSLFNPGELSGHMYGKSTFGIWETNSNAFELVTIKNHWVDVRLYKHSKEYDEKLVQFDRNLL